MTEQIINKGTREYRNLEFAAITLGIMSPNGWDYYVHDTYLDFGQDWKWTTILCSGLSTYQALNPVEWKRIVGAKTPEEIVAVCRDVMGDRFNPDKERR